MAEIFQIQHLTFFYPEQPAPAIQDLSLTVERGEFLVLCGPSGCGKTTLLRQFKSVMAPHGRRTGEILFEGRPLDDLDQREQTERIGFVQQSPENQIVTDKVWHELAFGLESLGYDTPTIRRRVAEMASFFGIQTWFHKNVTELSGGQKQLLNLASIMAMQLNCKEGPAADLEFRKALQCGINKEEINIGVYEGTASMGDIPIPPAFSGYPEDGSFDTVAFDADAAKAHLEASGYNGEEFEIITVSGTKNESAAQIVQGQLINLGINCVVTAVDASSYFAKYKAGEYDASMRAGGISILDADGLYSIYNAEYTTGITGNSDIGIWNDELINLLKEGRVTVDEAARKSLYAQVCNIITENVYSVTLYYDVNAVAYNSDLQGVVPSQLVGLYYINDWSWK